MSCTISKESGCSKVSVVMSCTITSPWPIYLTVSPRRRLAFPHWVTTGKGTPTISIRTLLTSGCTSRTCPALQPRKLHFRQIRKLPSTLCIYHRRSVNCSSPNKSSSRTVGRTTWSSWQTVSKGWKSCWGSSRKSDWTRDLFRV
uniref:Uncharacterized protein n=1 Tax=Cacopsylla melanoneura TaxID=428564 RepID=A0A8D8XVN0_9HEMI